VGFWRFGLQVVWRGGGEAELPLKIGIRAITRWASDTRDDGFYFGEGSCHLMGVDLQS